MAALTRLPDLWVPGNLWAQMRADVARRAPEEACGLVAGREQEALKIYPITNQIHSPTRYRLDPAEQVGAFSEIEQQGLELLAIYHSHPSGPAEPSATDVAESYYPETVYLIWHRDNSEWLCRGFFIRDGRTEEALVVLSD